MLLTICQSIAIKSKLNFISYKILNEKLLLVINPNLIDVMVKDVDLGEKIPLSLVQDKFINVFKKEDFVLDYDFDPGEIEVAVIQDDEPVENAKILAGRNAPVPTDSLGKCTFKVKPGQVEVLVLYPDKKTTARKKVTVESGKRVVLEF